MTEGDRDYLGQGDWRKRIHQLKQELRSASTEPSLTIPEQAKPYGTELNPKRDRNSAKQPCLKSEIASTPAPQSGYAAPFLPAITRQQRRSQ